MSELVSVETVTPAKLQLAEIDELGEKFGVGDHTLTTRKTITIR